MTERPILCSGAEVRAILDGRKTQMRMPVSPQPVASPGYEQATAFHADTEYSRAPGATFANRDVCPMRWWFADGGGPRTAYTCPMGAPGDRLWAREKWRYHDWTEDGLPWIRYAADDAHRLCENIPDDWRERVCDAWAELSDPDNYAIDGAARDRVWRPSIFLPRWASRLTLDVTEVRVERLQAITEEDAIAEGTLRTGGRANLTPADFRPARDLFRDLWDAINGKRAPWASNPWVWVVGFRRVEVAP